MKNARHDCFTRTSQRTSSFRCDNKFRQGFSYSFNDFYSILYSSNEYFVGGVWLQGRSIHNHLRNLDNSLANRNSNCFSSGLDLFNIKNYWEVVERWKV